MNGHGKGEPVSGKEGLTWAACISLTVITGAVNSVWLVFLLKKIVEVILEEGSHAPRLLVIFVLSAAAGALLEILRRKLQYILYRVREIRLEDRLILAGFDRGGGGKEAFVLIQNTVNDLVTKQTAWVLDCCNMAGVSVILSIYTCSISVTAFLFCLVITGIALLMMWESSRKIPDAAKRSNGKMNAVYGEMWNYLRCKEILPFLRPGVYGKYEKKLEENRQAQVLLGKYTNTARICMRFGSTGITLVAIVYFGMLVIRGRFLLSELLAVTMLLPGLAESLLQIPNSISQYKKLKGMERNVNAFLQADVKEEGKREPLGERISYIQVSDMEYSYKEGECSCRTKGFAARGGSSIGIYGESGAGKTTLLRLILGELQGDAGECLINGRRAGTLDRRELWSHILYLPQTSVLLPVSLRENVTLTGKDGQTEEKRYAEALRKAGIEELAAAKGEGTIDESALSSGEIQKVCLARCFYTDKEVILLDEATNALSPGAEKSVLHNLINEVAEENKILILVSHNPAVIDLCDTRVRIQKDAADN